MWNTRLIAHHNKILRPSHRDLGYLPGFVPMRYDHSISLISSAFGQNQYSGAWTSTGYCPSFIVGTDASDVASWRFLDSGHSKFSIAFWIKPEGQELLTGPQLNGGDALGRYAKKQVIIDNLGGASDDGFEIYLEGSGSYTGPAPWENTIDGVNNKVTFKVGSVTVSSNPSTVDFANDITDSSLHDTWRHVVCTYDSSLGSNNMKIYINGTLHEQANCTTVLDVTSMPVIGRNRAQNTSSNMVVTSTSYDASTNRTTITGTGAAFGNTTTSPVTIAGTSNNNGTSLMLDGTSTMTSFQLSGGSADDNESGLSGATANIEHLHPVVKVKIGDIEIWDASISAIEARLVWWLVAEAQLHVNWNIFNSGNPYFPIITNPRKLFAWYRMGDGLEYVNSGPGHNNHLVYNMSGHTGWNSGATGSTRRQRDLYGNVTLANSEVTPTLRWPISIADSPCNSGARRRR